MMWIRRRRAATGLLGLAGMVAFAPRCLALALLNDAFALPDGLANDIVRIQETYTTDSGAKMSVLGGTGTIINVAPCSCGGYWYDILTADHVVRAPTGDTLQGVSIGFRFDSAWPLSVANLKTNIQYDNPVDLAIIAIEVPKNAPDSVLQPLSLLQPVPIMAPDVAQGNQIVQAGYGLQAKVVSSVKIGDTTYPYAYKILPYNGTSFIPKNGTLLVGANTAKELNPSFSYTNQEVKVEYTYKAILGTFTISTNNGEATSGTTYTLNGDSGGPTFQSNGNGGFALVGVHSAAEFYTLPNGRYLPYNTPGQQWADVNVSQYTNWIADAEKAANVCPEASTWAMMLIGLAGLGVAGYRKAKSEANGYSA